MTDTATDGRVARGQRTRAAIVVAFLDLLSEGVPSPTARDIAARAGVSVRSIFQHFDDLEALRTDVVHLQGERIAPLIDGLDQSGPLGARIAALVTQRRTLYEHIAPLRRSIARVERTGAVQAGIEEMHDRLRRQLEAQFAAELQGMPRAQATAVLAAADAVTSFEAWDQLRSIQRLTPDASTRALRAALAGLLA